MLGNRTVPATASTWKWEKLRDINFFLQYSSNCTDDRVRFEYEGLARFFRAYFYLTKCAITETYLGSIVRLRLTIRNFTRGEIRVSS